MLLIDDEQHCLDVLSYELECLGVRKTDFMTTTSSKEAIKLIREFSPELIFLDIDMPLVTGFDLIEATLEQDYDFIVTTAHERYAISALKAQAMDFLLKPITGADLAQALDNFKKRRKNNIRRSLHSLKMQLAYLQNSQNLKTITIADSTGYKICRIEDIISIVADGEYSHVFMKNDAELLSSKNLGYYETILPTNQFMRIHRKHIVNLSKINYLDKTEGGSISMENGKTYAVARSKMKLLRSRLLPSPSQSHMGNDKFI